MIGALTTLLLLASPATLKASVDGEGFFRFLNEGRAVYLKEATFKVDKGRLCHVSGAPVIPTVTIYGEPEKLTVELDGTIHAISGETDKKVGRFVLALFGPDLRPMESGEWLIAADKPTLGNPGDGENGVIRMTAEESKPEVKPEIKPPVNDPPVTPPTDPKTQPTTPEPQPKTLPVTVDTELLKNGGVQVVLRGQSDIEGERILLGEIADIYANADLAVQATEIDLGPSGPPGSDRKVNRATILSRLKALGLKEAQIKITGPSVASATRIGQGISHEDFVAAAIAAAQAQLGDAVNYKSDAPGGVMTAPIGETKIVTERVTQGGAKVTVILAVYVNGERFNSRTITLSIDAPVISVKVGQAIKVRVRSNGAMIETTGIVRSVRPELAQVTVETENKAVLTGTYKNGIVEVKA